jgi:predicted aldo/keto reductase-like oxidoreductase
MRRRDFLKTAAYSTAALAINRILPAAETPEPLRAASSSNAPALLKRSYGRKGDAQLSIIGFPGLMFARKEQDRANRIVAEAVERGVCYFDVAPAYGKAEVILGPALEPYRKNVFLSCKTGRRTREESEAELKRSLERLKTDHFDLYQMHNLADVKKDVDAAFMKDGAMETFLQAKKEGRVRHLGFTAHTVRAALAAMDRYEFDSVMFPLNFAAYFKGDFGPQILEKAKSKDITRIAIKPGIRGNWDSKEDQSGDKKFGYLWYQPLSNPHDAELSLRFTLSQPIAAAIPPQDEDLFRMALDFAMRYKPLVPEEEREVKAMADLVKKPLFPRE